MKNKLQKTGTDSRAEYDFDYSKAIRGKYYQRLSKEGANVVVLEPDIAKVFRDSAAVNDVLRSLLELTRSTRRGITRSRGRATKTEVRRSI